METNTTHLFNGAFVDALYEDFLQDPTQVDADWRAYFEQLQIPEKPNGTAQNGATLHHNAINDIPHRPIQARFLAHGRRSHHAGQHRQALADQHSEQVKNQNAVLRLINYYRYLGHQMADLDPLQLHDKPNVADLALSTHGLAHSDMNTVFNTGTLFTFPTHKASLHEIYQALQNIYCHHIGVEYMHITDTAQKRWLQKRLETDLAHADPSKRFGVQHKLDILDRLAAAEGMEYYLDKHYPGQKRFSLEGGESLIPLLDTILQSASKYQVKETVLGMAHRGRLNVLVNVMGKSPKELFSEFEGKVDISNNQITGDVKYHKGYSSDLITNNGQRMHLVLAFNPSHLEIINPVVEGSVRARQDKLGDDQRKQVLPLLIHGDAAFSGQGVVMETLNLSDTHGYKTGGTLHIIINNQIGFTTSDPCDARSTFYCTDVVKMVEAPIFHVNGDDPEAVVYVTKLALDFRMAFSKDVVIDMVCYRRHGHNEADEPAATQPLMYKAIRQHTTVHTLYAEKLVAEGIISSQDAEAISQQYRADLAAQDKLVQYTLTASPHRSDWKIFAGQPWTAAAKTRLDANTLQSLGKALTQWPSDFQPHRIVEKLMHKRIDMLAGNQGLDWGMAETLAYASLLQAGYGIRLSGQDSERGTFAHRHSVLHDAETGFTYTPLAHIGDDQAPFRVFNSLLSEAAVLGFELGYSSSEPNILTIWEAQFGDFANGAQVVIDQFISSSEAKWQRLCGLVMLLPHGYDGQGPEHSSARIERYLQLCAQENIQVCIPSTPVQFFHLLRRQMLRNYRKPLIVFTPKSLLRDKRATSELTEFSQQDFQILVDDPQFTQLAQPPAQIDRILCCSGQVYYNLLEERAKRGLQDRIAIIRLEQLYPFPKAHLQDLIARYAHVKDWRWVQNEPHNQGAWRFLWIRLKRLLAVIDSQLDCVSRPSAASPAAGSLKLHQRQLQDLLDQAFQ